MSADLKPSNPLPWWHLLILTLIVCLGVVLRFHDLEQRPLWFDEVWHVELSSGWGSAWMNLPLDQWIDPVEDFVFLTGSRPWPDIWRNMDGVLHPPVYHTFLRVWRTLVGDNIWAWRALSAALSTVAIVLLYALARHTLFPIAGLWAAAILAVSPTQIEQARDTRGYSLVMLIAIATLWPLLVMVGRTKSSLTLPVLIGIGCLAMMLTHYFAAGACLGIAVCAAMFLRGGTRWWTLGSIALAGAIFVVLWGPTVRAQLEYVPGTTFFLDETPQGHVARSLVRFVQLPGALLVDPQVLLARSIAAEVVDASMLLVGSLLWVLMGLTGWRHPWLRVWVIVFSATALMLLGLDLMRHTKHLAFVRYALLVAPTVAMIVAGSGLVLLGKNGKPQPWMIHGLPACIVILGLLVLAAGVRDAHRGDNVQPLAEHLQRYAAPDEPIIVVSIDPQGRGGQTTYLYLSAYGRLFPRPYFIMTRPHTAASIGGDRPIPTAWLVLPNASVPLEAIIPGATLLDVRDFTAEQGVGALMRVSWAQP